MIAVYKPQVAEGYQWVIPVGKNGYSAIWNTVDQRRGKRVANQWVPALTYLWEGDEESGPLRRADMPWFAGRALVVTTRARDVLMPALGSDAELLPLATDGEDLWLVNAWRVIDALDEDRSQVKRFSGSKRIMRIKKYVFKQEELHGITCFRIPQHSGSMFTTEAVAVAARDAGLTGVHFQRIWEST